MQFCATKKLSTSSTKFLGEFKDNFLTNYTFYININLKIVELVTILIIH